MINIIKEFSTHKQEYLVFEKILIKSIKDLLNNKYQYSVSYISEEIPIDMMSKYINLFAKKYNISICLYNQLDYGYYKYKCTKGYILKLEIEYFKNYESFEIQPFFKAIAIKNISDIDINYITQKNLKSILTYI